MGTAHHSSRLIQESDRGLLVSYDLVMEFQRNTLTQRLA